MPLRFRVQGDHASDPGRWAPSRRVGDSSVVAADGTHAGQTMLAPRFMSASIRLDLFHLNARKVHDMPNSSEIKALLFDVFGTVVDWRSGVARDAGQFLKIGRA